MRLRVTHPSIGEITVPLEQRGLVVGREGGEADLEMNWDRRASRRHVRFWIEGGVPYYEDLGSRNGTWEGEQRKAGRHPLRPGAWLLVGETLFCLAREPAERAARRESGLETLDILPSLVADLTMDVPAAPATQKTGPTTDDLKLIAIPTSSGTNPPLGTVPPASALPPPRLSTAGSGFGAHTDAQFAALTAPPSFTPNLKTALREPLPRPVTSPPIADVGFGGDTEEFPNFSDEPGLENLVLAPRAGTAPPIARGPSPAPTAASGAAPTIKFDVRLGTDGRVTLKLAGREALKALWSESISKGALFAETDAPPARGSKVRVLIQVPAGEIELAAEVVHVVEPRSAPAMGPAGVGLQLARLTQPQRDAILRYLEGSSAILEAGTGPAAPDATTTVAAFERTLTRARELIGHIEKEDIYKGLGLLPKSTDEEVAQRIAELRQSFAAAEARSNPPQLARLRAASKLLDRVASLMSKPERRLAYDFRHGEVRAEARIAAAEQKKGPSLQELRAIWGVVLPENLSKAAEIVRKALEAKKQRDLVTALQLARDALELDPFHSELRNTVKAWEAALKQPPSSRPANT